MPRVNTRRRLLALGLAWPLAARAQAPSPRPKAKAPARLYRVGVLEATSQSANRQNYDALVQGLRDRGYVEGKTLALEYRSADGRGERFPALADELAAAKVEVIVVRGTPAALAARQSRLPVVMAAVADPVGAGIVKSLESPGGNVTGLATLVRQLTGPRMAILKELLPKAERVGHLLNLSNPAGGALWKEAEAQARNFGLQALLLEVREPRDFAVAFDTAMEKKADGVLVSLDPLIVEHRRAVAEFATRHKLPAIYADGSFVEQGGLMSLGVHYPHLYYRAAGYVDRILRGATPAELPVEQPAKFFLVVNQRVARAQGIALPAALVQRADRLIG